MGQVKKIITIANQKGGSGKTTTALALAQAAAASGLKVLCIDLDSQANLTETLDGSTEGLTALDFLNGSAPPLDCIQATKQGIDLVAANYDLAALRTEAGSARRLQKALEGVSDYRQYNLVIIDTPNVGEAQYNALQASTDLVVPLGPSLFDRQGLYTMAATAAAIANTNPNLKLTGYIFANYNGRSNITKTIAEAIEAEAQAHGIAKLGVVRQGVAIREAQALRVSLFEYAPKSKPAQDYMSIFKKLALTAN